MSKSRFLTLKWQYLADLGVISILSPKPMSNISIRTLTILISLLIALIVATVDLWFEASWQHFAVIFLVVLISSSTLLYYVIDIYLRNRIRLVYKVIHQYKLSKSLKESIGDNLGEDPLKEMEAQVESWVADKGKEIEDLRKMEQFRKEFLGNLSHELKTPLFNIQGYVHTLLDGALDKPKTAKQFLERTAKSVERLSNLLDDLDEISRLERGEALLVRDSFDITRLVKEVFESMELKASNKNIRLTIEPRSDKAFYVTADKEKIRQIITNLVDNSIKYGKENGETTAGFYDMDENVLVEITDNGIGISEEHLPRLFERFYRIDKHRSREQGGTGLGLAIVKHILEAHHQTINVRSSVGVGTTFAFTLEKAIDK
jgi:two-component system, OmpR family, phosphate regulon sensor histidine kinase PhoR